MINIGETNMAMAVGYHRLGSPYRDYQLAGTKLLIACDPTNDAAITRLLEIAWDYDYCIGAIEQLGRLRPMPGRVRSMLEAISTKERHPGRLEAENALKTLKKEEEQTNSSGR